MNTMKDKLLRSLPPEIAAKMREAEKDEGLQHATEAFNNMMQNATEALTMVVTVAWEEAATAEEKEDAVRAGAVLLTLIEQTKSVLGFVLPPQPRKPIFHALLGGMSREVIRYDGWLRQALPEAAKVRAQYIAAEREKTATT